MTTMFRDGYVNWFDYGDHFTIYTYIKTSSFYTLNITIPMCK